MIYSIARKIICWIRLQYYRTKERIHRFLMRHIGMQGIRLLRKRMQFDVLLCSFVKAPKGCSRFVCIEGCWDNPHHWLRLAIFGKLLQEHFDADLLGLVTPAQGWTSRRSLRAVGAIRVVDALQKRIFRAQAEQKTRELLQMVRTGADVLRLELFGGVPASRLYDTLLKRQFREQLCLYDETFLPSFQNFIESCLSLEALFSQLEIACVLTSHSVGSPYSALVWIALQRGIPVYLVDNYCGSLRGSYLSELGHLYAPIDSPDPSYRTTLSSSLRQGLAKVGFDYLQRRFFGNTLDLGGRLAFGGSSETFSKEALCAQVDLDPSRPLACIMMCNWFDYPHTYGLYHFENIVDWISFTVKTIAEDIRANWLIKTHPAEQRWYGGANVRDMLGSLPPHIRYFPDEVHATTLFDAAIGIVTPHGTCGIEYSAMGKNVLLAGSSFYSDWGFCQVPVSREDYASRLLALPHLSSLAQPEIQDARVYAALYFGLPSDTPEGYQFPCDTNRFALLNTLPDFLARHAAGLHWEEQAFSQWLASGLRSYHAFKVARSLGSR
ncbi:conserved hypothetical protein [Desulfovibrionales bacterium]